MLEICWTHAVKISHLCWRKPFSETWLPVDSNGCRNFRAFVASNFLAHGHLHKAKSSQHLSPLVKSQEHTGPRSSPKIATLRLGQAGTWSLMWWIKRSRRAAALCCMLSWVGGWYWDPRSGGFVLQFHLHHAGWDWGYEVMLWAANSWHAAKYSRLIWLGFPHWSTTWSHHGADCSQMSTSVYLSIDPWLKDTVKFDQEYNYCFLFNVFLILHQYASISMNLW